VTCTVQVQFLPTAVGTRMGAAVLSDQSDPPKTLVTVFLSGTGMGPLVAFGPGIASVFAGNYTLGQGYSGDGGPATSAQLRGPAGVAVDALGNLYIVDSSNFRIRKVTPGGTITTVAGDGKYGSGGDGGPATSAQLDPYGVAVDGAGNLYIADTRNALIREVTPEA